MSSRNRGLAMASPPPSDGLMPSSPATMMPPSSPLQEDPSRKRTRRERRKPNLTPRKFRRFFTPRSERLSNAQDGRPALGESSESILNTHLTSPASTMEAPDMSSPIRKPSGASIAFNISPTLESRKRKRTTAANTTVQSEASDLLSSPSISLALGTRTSELNARNLRALGDQIEDATRSKPSLINYFKSNRGGSMPSLDGKLQKPLTRAIATASDDLMIPGYKPKPVMKLRNRGFGAQLLLREQGITPRPGLERIEYPAHDQRSETARFFTRDTDVYTCTSNLARGHTIPFSLASCRSAPITAVGDEEGFIRLFDTTSVPANVSEPNKVAVVIHAHDNAIMDLAFSDNDLRLATACGDCNGKIIDVMSQSVAVELKNGHFQSMRRVEFQPGQANGDILATSDREGRVQIWDIRCSSAPAATFTTLGPHGANTTRDPNMRPLNAKPTNTLGYAHARTVQGDTKGASVTALQWMPAGREHLLLSASEANSCIKLWDTRYIAPRHKPEATPLAITAAPSSHKWRPYGLTSMALSSDASRLYAVCKDSTVYAYSTAHLMLGPAPELSHNPPRQKPGTSRTGLGPLYGFRHPSLNVGSFYVRCALRTHQTGSGSELLAVGSATHSAILFPTDERALREKWDRDSHARNHDWDAGAKTQGPGSGARLPIVRNGTQLADGHRREVTGLSWSNEGKLVTISDDYTVRHWQEDACVGAGDRNEDVPRDARDLRTCGDFGRKRWMAGWARTEEGDWDEDDDDHSEC
ncbi:hypothetical protein ACHAQA_000838 [Verticillium albo-atrum]